MKKSHYINNAWQPSSGGGAIPIIDPSTGDTFGELARGTEADIAGRGRGGACGDRRVVRRPLGTDVGRASRTADAQAVGRGHRAQRGVRAARGARHRQVAEDRARRCHGTRALLRVLRRRVRQAARRDAAVRDRLHRPHDPRAPRRHRPHHPVELPDADLRPHGGRVARRRQRLRRQAGRGREPVDPAPRRAGGRDRVPARHAQRGHRVRARGRRVPDGASRHRSHLLHRIHRHRPAGRARPRRIVTVPSRWSSGASRRSSCSRTRTSMRPFRWS